MITASHASSARAPTPADDETILLVEDEPSLRVLGRLVLGNSGYNVLEAMDGAHALRVAAEHAGAIHLLVSDIIMPHLGGRELAGRLLALYPEMKVLFTSGYTDEAVMDQGVLHEKVNFLQKPFSTAVLIQQVRAILDSPNGKVS